MNPIARRLNPNYGIIQKEIGSAKIAIPCLSSKPPNCFLNLELHSIYSDTFLSLYEMNFKV